jgi:hypothetical protein
VRTRICWKLVRIWVADQVRHPNSANSQPTSSSPSHRKSNMTANPIEYNFDICSEDAQYTLHDKNETTVQFSIILNQVPCTVCLIFTPFRRPSCNLIYHEYEIRCTIPLGAPLEAVSRSKHLIVAEVQRLYTKCFAKPGHKLVLQTE